MLVGIAAQHYSGGPVRTEQRGGGEEGAATKVDNRVEGGLRTGGARTSRHAPTSIPTSFQSTPVPTNKCVVVVLQGARGGAALVSCTFRPPAAGDPAPGTCTSGWPPPRVREQTGLATLGQGPGAPPQEHRLHKTIKTSKGPRGSEVKVLPEPRRRVCARLFGGGAAGSVQVDKEAARRALGADFDEQAFDAKATDGVLTVCVTTPRPPAPNVPAGSTASGSEDVTEPAFELSTPMLTMPFPILKDQGRIFKSTKEWRTEALEKGWLVVHAKVEGGTGKVVDGVLDGTLVITSEGKVVIFLSHTCTRTASAPSQSPHAPVEVH